MSESPIERALSERTEHATEQPPVTIDYRHPERLPPVALPTDPPEQDDRDE